MPSRFLLEYVPAAADIETHPEGEFDSFDAAVAHVQKQHPHAHITERDDWGGIKERSPSTRIIRARRSSGDGGTSALTFFITPQNPAEQAPST